MMAGMGAFSVAGRSQVADRVFTPPLTMGPFYPQVKPLDQDADLTIIKGGAGRAEGKVIHVRGHILNRRGEPVKNARIEIWQADSYGRYAHKSDQNKAKLDTNFQGYCVLKSDSEGRFRFKTIMPAPYPGIFAGMRTPHIHFDVFGKHDRLVTQMFFPDEPLNRTDRIFQEVRSDAGRAALTAKVLPSTSDIGKDETLFGWDCVLLTG
jgi:protocatechuate 3,4-dioxygenase beta subunit